MENIIAGYDAAVFDMDGVIFDSEYAVLLCWRETAEKYGLKDLEKTYYKCIGTTIERTREIMLETFGGEFPYDAYAKEVGIMFHERYDDGRLPVKTGVRELLCFLKRENKKIALASSTKRNIVERELGWAGLREYFDMLVCGDMVQRSKPAPDIFLKACERLGTAPERTYAIEDSYNGIRAAAAGGLRPIMVPDMLPATEEMRALAEAVLPDLIRVREYLGRR